MKPCIGCRFYHARYSECRKHAPVAMLVAVGTNRDDDDIGLVRRVLDGLVGAVWPITRYGCGDFEEQKDA